MKRAAAIQPPMLTVVPCAPVSAPLAFTVNIPAEAFGSLIERTADAVAERIQSSTAPALLDRSDLARALGCSVGTVNRLIHDGVPCVWLVDSRRFELAAVLEFLRNRKPSK